MIIAIITPIIIYLLITVIVSVITGAKLDKDGKKVERKIRYRRKTYDDGFGKYTVDVKDEEWVAVPKNK